MLSTGCHLSNLLPSWWLFWRLWPDYVRQIISRGEPIKVTATPYSGPFLLLPRLHPHELPSATHSSHCGLWHVFFHYDGLKFLKPWAKIKPSSLRVLSFLHQSQGTGHWCRRGGVTPVISLTVWSAGWIWKALETGARDVPQCSSPWAISVIVPKTRMPIVLLRFQVRTKHLTTAELEFIPVVFWQRIWLGLSCALKI